MKRSLACCILVVTFACAFVSAQTKPGGSKGADLQSEMPADAKKLNIGDRAPDFSLKGIDGKTYTLEDFKQSPILLVAFLSNHCPYSHAAETRLIPMAAEMKSRGVATVAINPNSPDALHIGELGYSKYNDSFEEMKLYAKDVGFVFPYLYDGDTQKTAKAYGALCTPHIFIFDRERKLRYMGRVDDSRYADPATVTSPDARNALEAMLAGKPVPVEVTKPMGCSTKWLEKKSQVAKVDQQWAAAPVTLETIDADAVKELAKNPTNKLRLINVWATWCAPCVAEFPGLVSISRRLANRDFELITISLDDPKDQAKAHKFLEEQRAAVPNRVQRSLKAEGRQTNNYLFTGSKPEGLMKALDPEAPGPVPYTLVIAPGGKIIYRHAGEVDTNQLQAKLIETLGPYYTPAPADGDRAATPPAPAATPPAGAIVLFDGKNLDAWVKKAGKDWLKEDGPPKWKLVDGDAVEVVPAADSIITRQTFGDFKLHLEFRTLGQKTNSGVYLQSRYEVNISEQGGSPSGTLDNCTDKSKRPSVDPSKGANEWQTLDIDFRAPRFDSSGSKTENARATVALNGTRLYENQPLDPPRGAAGRLGEAPTGPLLLQEHGTPVQFRNIWILPIKAD